MINERRPINALTRYTNYPRTNLRCAPFSLLSSFSSILSPLSSLLYPPISSRKTATALFSHARAEECLALLSRGGTAAADAGVWMVRGGARTRTAVTLTVAGPAAQRAAVLALHATVGRTLGCLWSIDCVSKRWLLGP